MLIRSHMGFARLMAPRDSEEGSGAGGSGGDSIDEETVKIDPETGEPEDGSSVDEEEETDEGDESEEAEEEETDEGDESEEAEEEETDEAPAASKKSKAEKENAKLKSALLDRMLDDAKVKPKYRDMAKKALSNVDPTAKGAKKVVAKWAREHVELTSVASVSRKSLEAKIGDDLSKKPGFKAGLVNVKAYAKSMRRLES